MDSKGNGEHFVGLHFAWHGLEACCCSSVSHGLLHGTPWKPAGVGGNGTHFVGLHFALLLFKSFAWAKHCFLWLPKVT